MAPSDPDAFRVDLRPLRRQPGAAWHVARSGVAPAEWAVGTIGVPEGEPIDLDVDLEAVGEGVLATGRATFQLSGQCARCLAPIRRPGAATFQELFVYPGHSEDDEDASRVRADAVDLLPVVRDTIVLDLPLVPLCDDDCLGLCAECGANLNDEPSHAHGATPDARWAGLSGLVVSQSENVAGEPA
ncbi:MAG: DUF177 domain-containing protein [Propionibacteriaceae bacterium]|jgi:uncharacterized protein|nr:DUF177 domain-containing protein [Propionibacteriaceae bacterium]